MRAELAEAQRSPGPARSEGVWGHSPAHACPLHLGKEVAGMGHRRLISNKIPSRLLLRRVALSAGKAGLPTPWDNPGQAAGKGFLLPHGLLGRLCTYGLSQPGPQGKSRIRLVLRSDAAFLFWSKLVKENWRRTQGLQSTGSFLFVRFMFWLNVLGLTNIIGY